MMRPLQRTTSVSVASVIGSGVSFGGHFEEVRKLASEDYEVKEEAERDNNQTYRLASEETEVRAEAENSQDY